MRCGKLATSKPVVVVKKGHCFFGEIADSEDFALVGSASPQLREARNVGNHTGLFHRVLLDPCGILGDPSLGDGRKLPGKFSCSQSVSIQ